jgi:hypothetical protein
LNDQQCQVIKQVRAEAGRAPAPTAAALSQTARSAEGGEQIGDQAKKPAAVNGTCSWTRAGWWHRRVSERKDAERSSD